jgi:Uma2 family endonuclease
MTASEFLEWCTRQEDERYELVDGVTMLKAGATDRHSQIVVNLIVVLAAHLRGGPCRTHTAGFAMLTSHGANVRRPDVLVDCGPRDPMGLFARTPTAVFEVLSPSTENVTLSSKLDEYKALASMRHVVLLDQDKMFLIHHARAANDAWVAVELKEPAAVLKLDAIRAEITLAEIYADVAFGEAAGEG